MTMRAGDIAGYIDANGFRQIEIDGIEYEAGSLIWLYVHGRWPEGELEHIDGNRDNNRIDNLREVGD